MTVVVVIAAVIEGVSTKMHPFTVLCLNGKRQVGATTCVLAPVQIQRVAITSTIYRIGA